MGDYNLTREDWDSITDISKWGNEADVATKIPSKVGCLLYLYAYET